MALLPLVRTLVLDLEDYNNQPFAFHHDDNVDTLPGNQYKYFIEKKYRYENSGCLFTLRKKAQTTLFYGNVW